MLRTPAGLPAFVSLLASLSPLLPCHLSPESVTAFSFIYIYFPLPSCRHPFSSIWLHSTSPSLLPRIPTLPNHVRDNSRAVPKLPQVLIYLAHSDVSSLYCTVCGKNDTAALHVLPEDIILIFFVFTGNRHLHHASVPNSSLNLRTKIL